MLAISCHCNNVFKILTLCVMRLSCLACGGLVLHFERSLKASEIFRYNVDIVLSADTFMTMFLDWEC
jgi:hypothetical protein